MKIAFYKGTLRGRYGWFSRLARWADQGRYSHCEVVFSDGLCASASWYDGGVRFKKIAFNSINWDIVELNFTPEAEAKVRAWFQRHEGRPYDLRGSLGVVCRPFGQGRRGWFCSEAVAAAIGFKEPWRFSPNTLAALLETGGW